MSVYDYTKELDSFSEDSLKIEVNANTDITTEFSGVTSKESLDENGEPTGNMTVTFHFVEDITTAEKTALDAVVAAHTGAAPIEVVWHASSVLADHECEIINSDPAWTELGGAVTTPDFFVSNVATCKGRIVGLCRANGTGAILRLKEDDDSPEASYEIPDTGGEWQSMQWFSAESPTAGTHQYTLEGQLSQSGATEAAVKYVAVSLLEFK